MSNWRKNKCGGKKERNREREREKERKRERERERERERRKEKKQRRREKTPSQHSQQYTASNTHYENLFNNNNNYVQHPSLNHLCSHFNNFQSPALVAAVPDRCEQRDCQIHETCTFPRSFHGPQCGGVLWVSAARLPSNSSLLQQILTLPSVSKADAQGMKNAARFLLQ